MKMANPSIATQRRSSLTALWLVALLACSLAGCGGSSSSNPPQQKAQIAGSISGLTASGLILSMNGQTTDPASGASTFSFPTSLAQGTSYSITVSSQPTGQDCTVLNGSGTAGTTGQGAVNVTCENVYTVTGTIRHLHAGGLVLTDGTDTISPASGSTTFTFSTGLPSGDTYSVSVKTQPSDQTCSVTNGTGTIGSSDVSNVTVNCPYTVLYTFNSSSAVANAHLLIGADGNLYTIADQAGAFGAGDLIEYDLSTRTEAVLWQFTGSPAGTGVDPVGSLIQTTQGDFEGVTDDGGTDNNGTIFDYNTVNHTETDLTSFNLTSSGGTPVGGLGPYNNVVYCQPPCNGALNVPGPPGGQFYGLALEGGSSGSGTIYSVSPNVGSDVLTMQYSFGAPPDGQSPVGLLVWDYGTGMLYGMTSAGGQFGYGTLFEFNPTTKAETVLHSFGGASDGASPHGSLILASNGNLYGLTSAGGLYGQGGLFEYNVQAQSYSLLYSFVGGTFDGGAPDGTLLEATDGKFYGTTSTGGANNVGTLFSFDPSTSAEAVIHSFGAAEDIGNPEGSLIDDGSGNLYGTAEGGTICGCGSAIFEYQIN